MCHHAPVVAGVPPSHRDIGTVGADKSRVPCGEKGMPCKSGGGGGAGAGQGSKREGPRLTGIGVNEMPIEITNNK